MRIDTYIKKEDKVSQAKFKRDMKSYPVGTYIRFATKGCINDISSTVWGKVKTGEHEWTAYSSFYGIIGDMVRTDTEVLDFINKKDVKNIGVKFPSCT